MAITWASQAHDVGSIPITRSMLKYKALIIQGFLLIWVGLLFQAYLKAHPKLSAYVDSVNATVARHR